MVTKGNVLVVDDEINLCRILAAKLAKSGYSVVSVHDGLQAVEKVRESDFDIVLLDLILPKMDGLAALAEIRRTRTSLPVIVMTACENADALQKASSHGVSAYLNKPFDLDNLVCLVRDTTQVNSACHNRKLQESTVLFVKDQPITLEIQNSGNGSAYGSYIYAKDDRTLSVIAPVIQDRQIEVPVRTEVKVGLATKDAYYSFTSQVLKLDNNIEHLLVLDKPGVIYRSQRRKSFRAMMRIPLNYSYYTDNINDTQTRLGETRNVSSGGACIVVPEEVLPGEMLRIELRPKSDVDIVNAVAHVLRSKPNSEPGGAGYVLGCRFTRIDDTVRKLLAD